MKFFYHVVFLMLKIRPRCVCVLNACACVCSMCVSCCTLTCVYVCVLKYTSGWFQLSFSVWLYLHSWDRISLPEPMAHDFALTNKLSSPMYPPVHLPSTNITGMYHRAQIFTKVLGPQTQVLIQVLNCLSHHPNSSRLVSWFILRWEKFELFVWPQ